MQALTDLISNSQENLIKVIERTFPQRKTPLFLFPAGSGKWRALSKRSLRPNHRIQAVLYPDGRCEQICLRKQDHRLLKKQEKSWITWKQR